MDFTHLDDKGRAKMVQVGDKKDTKREAVAAGEIRMNPQTLELISQGGIKKGDVLSIAQVAGIMGAKNTASSIPMCHNIFLTGVEMDFFLDQANSQVKIKAVVTTTGKTGVEMEALNAVSVAALTIYDMCKAVDKNMEITNIRLIKKSGGKSGDFQREGNEHVW